MGRGGLQWVRVRPSLAAHKHGTPSAARVYAVPEAPAAQAMERDGGADDERVLTRNARAQRRRRKHEANLNMCHGCCRTPCLKLQGHHCCRCYDSSTVSEGLGRAASGAASAAGDAAHTAADAAGDAASAAGHAVSAVGDLAGDVAGGATHAAGDVLETVGSVANLENFKTLCECKCCCEIAVPVCDCCKELVCGCGKCDCDCGKCECDCDVAGQCCECICGVVCCLCKVNN